MIYAVIVGHLYPLTYGIVGLITSVCMIIIGLMMIQITPQLRDNVFIFSICRDTRVRTNGILQLHASIPTITTGRQNATPQKNKAANTKRKTILPSNMKTSIV
jgi:hypothetical protein